MHVNSRMFECNQTRLQLRRFSEFIKRRKQIVVDFDLFDMIEYRSLFTKTVSVIFTKGKCHEYSIYGFYPRQQELL